MAFVGPLRGVMGCPGLDVMEAELPYPFLPMKEGTSARRAGVWKN